MTSTVVIAGGGDGELTLLNAMLRDLALSPST